MRMNAINTLQAFAALGETQNFCSLLLVVVEAVVDSLALVTVSDIPLLKY